MSLRPPSIDEIEATAREMGLEIDSADAAAYAQLAAPFLEGLALLESLPDELPSVKYPRTPGVRPTPEENPLGAWYVKTRIEGASEGPLAGRTVALKDNVMLAGVPMSNGTSLLDGYVPPVDATIVTRMLDAGAVIAGKAVCEAFCASGGSHTSDSGPVRNPHDPTRTSGGSSSGSGALVAAGEVDMAIGCDQGGSIRIPASYCGIVGLKPTHGLVPYTGILGMDATIDHTGPMTSNVRDNALLLEVIAGADGIDGRQIAPRTAPYTQALDEGCEGLRIGVLAEGFDVPGCDSTVDQKVRGVAEVLGQLGATVREVSVPVHRSVSAVLVPVFQSAVATIFHTDGCGPGREDLFVPSLLDRQRSWRQRSRELPPTLMTFGLCAEILRRRYGWRYYAKAMNLVRRMRREYDRSLEEVDVLLMPTTPTVAPVLPAPDASIMESVAAAFTPISNTSAFDYTHHPALSLPCGRIDDLPVGAMLVGRAYDETSLYRAAQSFEANTDWRTL
jgi:amidase